MARTPADIKRDRQKLFEVLKDIQVEHNQVSETKQNGLTQRKVVENSTPLLKDTNFENSMKSAPKNETAPAYIVRVAGSDERALSSVYKTLIQKGRDKQDDFYSNIAKRLDKFSKKHVDPQMDITQTTMHKPVDLSAGKYQPKEENPYASTKGRVLHSSVEQAKAMQEEGDYFDPQAEDASQHQAKEENPYASTKGVVLHSNVEQAKAMQEDSNYFDPKPKDENPDMIYDLGDTLWGEEEKVEKKDKFFPRLKKLIGIYRQEGSGFPITSAVWTNVFGNAGAKIEAFEAEPQANQSTQTSSQQVIMNVQDVNMPTENTNNLNDNKAKAKQAVGKVTSSSKQESTVEHTSDQVMKP